MPDKIILPPRPYCQIKKLPKAERNIMRHLILSVIKSYPKEMFSCLGLEGTCEQVESLINKGWIQLAENSGFYSFMAWDAIAGKYIDPPLF